MTLDEMKKKAVQIQRDVDAIIDGTDANQVKGPVNWGDLGCTDVSVSLMDGLWCVTVEEASPDATELAAHIPTSWCTSGIRMSGCAASGSYCYQ